MVNKDMNGFPVKKCSAFQFFKKRVRRWIKSPMVSMEKHQTSSLKYPGSTVMHISQGEPDLEAPLCQMCFSDHTFPRGIVSQDTESCSWEGHRNCNVSKILSHMHLHQPEGCTQFYSPRPNWTDKSPNWWEVSVLVLV
uniref:Uncharacterized protein n=1 Tax=Varanus komodoensis TaxID=61221 RepID=A0A8D2L125_VARKO